MRGHADDGNVVFVDIEIIDLFSHVSLEIAGFSGTSNGGRNRVARQADTPHPLRAGYYNCGERSSNIFPGHR